MPSRIHPIRCPYANTAVMAYYVDAPSRALIDAGGAEHPHGPIRDGLRELGLDLADVGAIVNTHGHWDHAGGNAAVVAASGAGVTIHRLGEPLLLGHDAHLDGYFTQHERALGRPDLVAERHAAIAGMVGDPTPPERLIEEGDRIDFGDSVVFTALHVPGHSADMTALYWEREGVLIAGDAAQGTGSRAGSCPLYFHSIADARASLARLREIPFGTLHVSHPFGRLGTAERATTFDRDGGLAFLADSLAALDILEEAVRAALRRQPDADFPALARAATEELRRLDRWPLEPGPDGHVPANAAPTLHNLWRELTAGAGPGQHEGAAVDRAEGL